MMEEAEAREKLLKADLDDVTTKFNRLMAAGGGKKPGGKDGQVGRVCGTGMRRDQSACPLLAAFLRPSAGNGSLAKCGVTPGR